MYTILWATGNTFLRLKIINRLNKPADPNTSDDLISMETNRFDQQRHSRSLFVCRDCVPIENSHKYTLYALFAATWALNILMFQKTTITVHPVHVIIAITMYGTKLIRTENCKEQSYSELCTCTRPYYLLRFKNWTFEWEMNEPSCIVAPSWILPNYFGTIWHLQLSFAGIEQKFKIAYIFSTFVQHTYIVMYFRFGILFITPINRRNLTVSCIRIILL